MTRKFTLIVIYNVPLLLLLNPIEIMNISGFSIRIIDIAFISISINFIVYVLDNGKITKQTLFLTSIIASLFILVILGYLISNYYKVNWPTFLRLIQTIFWGVFGCTYFRTNKELNKLIYSLFISSSLLSAYSIYLKLSNWSLHRIAGWFSYAGGEGWGTQSSYNEIGTIHALCAIIAFYFIVNKKFLQRKYNYLAVLAFILNIMGLILTQSRSAFLSFIIANLLLFALIMKNKKIRKKKRVIIYYSTGLITIFLIFIAIVPTTINRYKNIFLGERDIVFNIDERIELWERSFAILTNNPRIFLIGNGYDYKDFLIDSPSAHNFFLNIHLSLGIIGVLIFFSIILGPLILNSSLSKEAQDLLMLVVTIAMIVSLTGNILVDPFYGGITFLLLYGISTSYSKKGLSRRKYW